MEESTAGVLLGILFVLVVEIIFVYLKNDSFGKRRIDFGAVVGLKLLSLFFASVAFGIYLVITFMLIKLSEEVSLRGFLTFILLTLVIAGWLGINYVLANLNTRKRRSKRK